MKLINTRRETGSLKFDDVFQDVKKLVETSRADLQHFESCLLKITGNPDINEDKNNQLQSIQSSLKEVSNIFNNTIELCDSVKVPLKKFHISILPIVLASVAGIISDVRVTENMALVASCAALVAFVTTGFFYTLVGVRIEKKILSTLNVENFKVQQTDATISKPMQRLANIWKEL